MDIQIINLRDGTSTLSNEFHFTFLARDTADKTDSRESLRAFALKPVTPTSYSEGSKHPLLPPLRPRAILWSSRRAIVRKTRVWHVILWVREICVQR